MADNAPKPSSVEAAPTAPPITSEGKARAAADKEAGLNPIESAQKALKELRDREKQTRAQEVAKEAVRAQGNPPDPKEGLKVIAATFIPNGEVIPQTQALEVVKQQPEQEKTPTGKDIASRLNAKLAEDRTMIQQQIEGLSTEDALAALTYLREQLAPLSENPLLMNDQEIRDALALQSGLELVLEQRKAAAAQKEKAETKDDSTIFDNEDDAGRREKGESTTTEDINLFINSAETKSLREFASMLEEEIRKFQNGESDRTPEQIAQMLRAQKLVSDKLAATPEINESSQAAIPSPVENPSTVVEPVPEPSIVEAVVSNPESPKSAEVEKKPMQFGEQVNRVKSEIATLELPDRSSQYPNAILDLSDVMGDSLFMADVTAQMLEAEKNWNILEAAQALREKREPKTFGEQERSRVLKTVVRNAYNDKSTEVEHRQKDELRKVISSRGEKLKAVKERLARLGDASNPNIEERVESDTEVAQLIKEIKDEAWKLNRTKEFIWVITFLLLVLGLTKESFTEGQKAVGAGQ